MFDPITVFAALGALVLFSSWVATDITNENQKLRERKAALCRSLIHQQAQLDRSRSQLDKAVYNRWHLVFGVGQAMQTLEDLQKHGGEPPTSELLGKVEACLKSLYSIEKKVLSCPELCLGTAPKDLFKPQPKVG